MRNRGLYAARTGETALKKTVRTILAAFSEALAEGAVVLPNLMFIGLYYQHYGEIEHVLPFVLLYVSEKAGVFLLSGFGTLKNPRIIWLAGCILADLGFLLLVFGGTSSMLWNVCAVLIGLGLANFPAMYKTTRDALSERKLWSSKLALILGLVVLEFFIISALLLRNNHMDALVVLMTALMLLSTLHCVLLHKHNPYRKEAVFEKNTLQPHQFVYGIIVLLFTFATRLYKQTAGEWLIVCIVAGLLALMIATILLRKREFRPWGYRSLWYGAVRNLAIIFSMIYFIAIGDRDELAIAYLMIGLGVFFGSLVAPMLKKRIREGFYEPFCMIAACVSSCLMVLPPTVCYMVGTLLTVMFATMGSSASLNLFLKDERYVATERRLVRSRFFSTGALVWQSVMLIALFAISAILTGSGTEALAGYSFQVGNADAELAYKFTLAICVVVNSFWAWRIMKIKDAQD